MHIVTFYSYKGGVGRTMALTNTAAVLAKRNRKVLIVDFDLEAPGISTYAPFLSLTSAKGVVEYVTEYIDTAKAPNASDFITECKLADRSVWVMPAGQRNRDYASRLNAIDWEALYAVHRGYLFFEDLKQQWRAQKFDYVLVDSRTGHTDVGGICTRQLPDAVVLMFFPNDQNLVGLESVAKEIRDETPGTRSTPITLHFCASNIPDLDDEEHILERKLSEAKRRLLCEADPALIHHYNSLTLLEQSIFVLDRPDSRLASEYQNLAKLIVSHNLEDQMGATFKLQSLRDKIRSGDESAEAVSTARETLTKIRKLHPTNPAVSWRVAAVYNLLGDLDDEAACVTIAIEDEKLRSSARRRRATIAKLQGRQEDAVVDLRDILFDYTSTAVDFSAAVELLRDTDPEWVSVVSRSPHLEKVELPEEAIKLSRILMSDERSSHLVIALMERTLSSTASTNKDDYDTALNQLVLALISNGQFEAALSRISTPRDRVVISNDVVMVFNYAVAEWGKTKAPSRDLMERVIQLMQMDQYRDPNRHQCIALAHFVCGNVEAALEELGAARWSLKHRGPRRIFSCWSYLEVSQQQMRTELDEMEKYIKANGPGPSIFTRRTREKGWREDGEKQLH